MKTVQEKIKIIQFHLDKIQVKTLADKANYEDLDCALERALSAIKRLLQHKPKPLGIGKHINTFEKTFRNNGYKYQIIHNKSFGYYLRRKQGISLPEYYNGKTWTKNKTWFSNMEKFNGILKKEKA